MNLGWPAQEGSPKGNHEAQVKQECQTFLVLLTDKIIRDKGS